MLYTLVHTQITHTSTNRLFEGCSVCGGITLRSHSASEAAPGAGAGGLSDCEMERRGRHGRSTSRQLMSLTAQLSSDADTVRRSCPNETEAVQFPLETDHFADNYQETTYFFFEFIGCRPSSRRLNRPRTCARAQIARQSARTGPRSPKHSRSIWLNARFHLFLTVIYFSKIFMHPIQIEFIN